MRNQFKFTFLVAVLLSFALGASAQSPKGAEALSSKRANAKVEVPSNVQGKNTVLQSGIKTLGTVGKTSRYEIVQVKVRGLDTPNLAGFVIYDSETDSIVGMQTAGAPGLGVAIVNGGSQVAGNYLFGSKLRPNNENISNGESSSTGNNAVGVGGNGGTAAASSSGGNATGGTATGGNSNAGQTGGSFTPPGQVNNPGHHGHNPHP